MTVGLRSNKGKLEQYCSQSVQSLRDAGFTEPLHLFVEPGAEVHIPKRDDFEVIDNPEQYGCYRNFRHGLKYLTDETDADWFLMLQDDAIWSDNSYEAFSAAITDTEKQRVGFLSPYTSKTMVAKSARSKRRESTITWHECSLFQGKFWGAVALAFPRESAERLENESRRFREHTHHRKLDQVLGYGMEELGLEMLMAVPSMVEHIGAFSTLGRHKKLFNQWARRGFLFQKTDKKNSKSRWSLW